MYLTQEQYDRLIAEMKRRSDESNIWKEGKRKAKYRNYEPLTLEECNEYCEYYLSENMKKFKEVVNKVIDKQSRKKGRYYSENERYELRDLSYEVFMMSLGTYSPKANCTFNTFFYGNLSRKFYSHGRDKTRSSRCNWEPVIDEKTNRYKLDEEGNIVRKPIFDISMYTPMSDSKNNSELWETFKCNESVEDSIFKEDEEIINKYVENFMENISRNAKKVATYIMDGYSEEVIVNEKGITRRQYTNAINEFRMFDNIHILLGGKVNGKNR